MHLRRRPKPSQAPCALSPEGFVLQEFFNPFGTKVRCRVHAVMPGSCWHVGPSAVHAKGLPGFCNSRVNRLAEQAVKRAPSRLAAVAACGGVCGEAVAEKDPQTLEMQVHEESKSCLEESQCQRAEHARSSAGSCDGPGWQVPGDQVQKQLHESPVAVPTWTYLGCSSSKRAESEVLVPRVC